MAALAYLFVECAPGQARRVRAQLSRILGVRDARIVTGEHDIIAIVEAADAEALNDVIVSKVVSIPGVHKTITNLVVE
jgi:DNA-binding Lrp family transcriptional regulator